MTYWLWGSRNGKRVPAVTNWMERFELAPQGAVEYIRERLSKGHTLSRMLLALPLESGQVFTYLPDDVDPHEAKNFKQGFVSGLQGSCNRATPAFISTYLAGIGRRYAVFEDIARPGDAALESPDERFFVYESEVYDFVSSEDKSVETIVVTMSRARQYPFVGALTALDETLALHPCQRVTREVLEMLAEKTQHVLVGAYDETAELIWSRAPSV